MSWMVSKVKSPLRVRNRHVERGSLVKGSAMADDHFRSQKHQKLIKCMADKTTVLVSAIDEA